MTAAAEVVHAALVAATRVEPLAAARLTDRQRLALLLEGAALLSLLEHAGWCLPRGWDGAGVSGCRLVVGPRAASPGRSRQPAQELLRDLLLRLFANGVAAAGAAAAPGWIAEETGREPVSGSGAMSGSCASPGSGPVVWSGVVSGSGLMPGGGTVAGRGQARRSARSLLTLWWQPLVPLPADEAVEQILAAAPFLWAPAFARARQALAGRLCDASGIPLLWVAGSGASRGRLLAGCAGAAELARRLGGPEARCWWEGDTGTSAVATSPSPDGALPAGASLPAVAPGAVGPLRRWRAAAAAAGRQPPATEPARLELAGALAGLGRFEAAVAILAACRSPAARLQRARCHLQLGRLGAARAGLRRLQALPLRGGEAVEAAEAALRVFANSGEPDQLPGWVERALAAVRSGPPWLRARAQLVAALAAWDRQEPAAMGRHLETAHTELFAAAGNSASSASGSSAGAGRGSGLAESPSPPGSTSSEEWLQVVWRFHHACGLRAMAAADGPAVVEHLGQALRHGRRAVARHEAAGLWNDLGVGRVQAGDLAGAERAFLHAQRLFVGCDGPRRATLALHNLAEVRLRRGRVAGVQEILERSTTENRRSGNLRGLTQDAELWARLELVHGRAPAAAALCREAMERLDRRRFSWRRDVLAVLRARALGWLERRDEATAELARATPEAIAELEPEERPAVWAHAGERETARRTAFALPAAMALLWRSVLDETDVSAAAWQALATLEPYRAARLVFDLERAAAAGPVAPAEWRRTAISIFRYLGADAMAAWLEARDASAWEALGAYAAAPAGDLQALSALLRAIGDPGARLHWQPAGAPGLPAAASSTEAAAGDRGLGAPGSCLAVDLPGGRLELRCRQPNPALVACFALAVRDLAASGPPQAGSEASATERDPNAGRTSPEALPRTAVIAGAGAAAPARSMVGSSSALRESLERLGRIAAVDIPVLIQGESGTGKELAAREIHRTSRRAAGPFLPVNCAAFTESLLLADLFGHARGAFTGADRERAGVFEAARGGTVLLDEIGDLPLAAQGLLLRVLQEGEVRRLGESLPRRVDVRVLAATHRDLATAVAAGAFRQDLFYRLKVGVIALPPLRQRGDDVLELADRFLARQPFDPPPRLSAAARDRLRRHHWPGNVRELENVLRLAAALAANGLIRPEHVELPAPAPGTGGASYHEQIERLRRQLLNDAITAAGGHQAEAARRLGISRQALSYLVRQLGLK